MEIRWRIELLGRLRASLGDHVVARFRTQKTASLLAYLAYYRHRVHPREALIELFWPDCEINDGRHSLSQALTSLRHQLEPPGTSAGTVIVASRTNVQLNQDAYVTDVAELEGLVAAARTVKGAERVQLLVRAVDLYQGELLPGIYDEWAIREREALAETVVQALRPLVRELEQAGDFARALRYAAQAAGFDPLREELRRDLMRVFLAAGQPSAAVRQYRALKRLLEEELGEAPEPETRKMVREIRQKEATLADEVTAAGAGAAEGGERPGGPTAATDQGPVQGAANAGLPRGAVTFLMTALDSGPPAAESNPGGRAGAIAPIPAGETTGTLNSDLAKSPGANGPTGLEGVFGPILAIHCGRPVRLGPAFLVACFERSADAAACALAFRARAAASFAASFALDTVDVEQVSDVGAAGGLEHLEQLVVAAHPGQVLCSESCAGLLRRASRPAGRLTDLGAWRLGESGMPERLFQLTPVDEAAHAEQPRHARPARQGNLPVQSTRFFGREDEIAGLLALLSGGARLVTLTGPGGTGKTRLALEVARRIDPRLNGRVWFVPLADLGSPLRIGEAIRDALQLERTQGDPLQHVAAATEGTPTLIVLDNLEHLLPDAAAVVRTLLDQAPSLSCLATSRQRLDLEGEREIIVPPLPVPDQRLPLEQLSRNESLRLFVDRARLVRPDFQVTEASGAALAALCAQLEGIPLAIELAAARVQVLTPAQLLERLNRRFDVLVSRRRDIAARHRTLRAAIESSYQLLEPELQRLFAQLSVFHGGWTMEDAEAVTGDPGVLDGLEQLRDSSLILSEPAGDSMRFRMLETLREYAAEQLEPAERAGLARRHAAHFLAMAEAAAPHLPVQAQIEWLGRLAAELDNLRAALDWSVEPGGDVSEGLRLGFALVRFWQLQGHMREGRERLMQLVRRPEAAAFPIDLARALSGAAALAYDMGDFEETTVLCEEARALQQRIGDPVGLSRTVNILGNVLQQRGDYVTAARYYEESLAVHRALGDPRGIAVSLNNLGILAMHAGDYDAADRLYAESLSLKQAVGDRRGIANSMTNLGSVASRKGDYQTARRWHEAALAQARALNDPRVVAGCLNNLGDVALYLGEYDAARALHDESLSIQRELEDLRGMATSLGSLGLVAYRQGDFSAAAAFHRESLALCQRVDGKQSIAECLEALVLLAIAQGRRERATRLVGAAAALRDAIGSPMPPAERKAYEPELEALRAGLGSARYAELCAEGAALPLEHAIALAMGEWSR